MPSNRTYTNVCEVCGKEFTSKRADARCCCSACRQVLWRRRSVPDKELAELYKKICPPLISAIAGGVPIEFEVEKANLYDSALLVKSGETILRMTTHIEVIHE